MMHHRVWIVVLMLLAVGLPVHAARPADGQLPAVCDTGPAGIAWAVPAAPVGADALASGAMSPSFHLLPARPQAPAAHQAAALFRGPVQTLQSQHMRLQV